MNSKYVCFLSITNDVYRAQTCSMHVDHVIQADTVNMNRSITTATQCQHRFIKLSMFLCFSGKETRNILLIVLLIVPPRPAASFSSSSHPHSFSSPSSSSSSSSCGFFFPLLLHLLLPHPSAAFSSSHSLCQVLGLSGGPV